MSELERHEIARLFERLDQRIIPLRKSHKSREEVLVMLVNELGSIAQSVSDEGDRAMFAQRMESAFQAAGFDDQT